MAVAMDFCQRCPLLVRGMGEANLEQPNIAANRVILVNLSVSP